MGSDKAGTGGLEELADQLRSFGVTLENTTPGFLETIAAIIHRKGHPEVAAECYRHAARLNLESGDPGGAAAMYGKLLDVAPQDAEALRGAADVAVSVDGRDLFLPQELITAGIRSVVARGTTFREGEEAGDLHLLLRGTAQLTKSARGGQQVSLAALEPGSSFGEMAVLGDGRRHATAVALEDCEVTTIDAATVQRLMRESAEIKRLLLAVFRERLQRILITLSPVFSVLDGEAAGDLIHLGTPRRARGGQVMQRQGEPSPGLTFVLLGTLEVRHQTSPGAAPVHVGYRGDGELFGERALWSDSRSRDTVTALGFAQLLFVSAEVFQAFAARHPQVLEAAAAEAAHLATLRTTAC